MAATAFTRFDPRAFLADVSHEAMAAKPAKPAKVPPERNATFATFATFAEAAAQKRNADPSADNWAEAHEERAAIAEHDGRAPRPWAEALVRLDPAHPPGDVPPRRWVQFIDDCGRFLDEGWAEQCATLGWGPLDLFGCDRERPWARIDHAGLLWLLNGRKLLALTADMAIIEGPTGGRTRYYRRCAPIEPGRVVLAWELRQ
jgi:hypothetical protein